MIKNNNDYAKSGRIAVCIDGVNEVLYITHNDKINYIMYKNKEEKYYSEDENLDLEILELLEKNGFSIEQLGTYLYKDVIKNVIKRMKESKSEKDIEQLKLELFNPYSQFYVNIARFDNDMGVKTFHNYISQAITTIDYNNVPSTLVKTRIENENYGELALDLAIYTLEPTLNPEIIPQNKPKIKRLVKNNK